MSKNWNDGTGPAPARVPVNYANIIARERAGTDRDGHNHELLYRATLALSEYLTERADAAERRGDAIDAALDELRSAMAVRAS